ncbi:MmgE/PrpD family protein [Nocardia jiangxiensis]|uniref:MmgE/PrpD family protein n=1 Tax=Nocardia jiangxiensis TaxID=282685 RepID=A0ABW6SC38_9NOCA|nr:MmgE/PrpD family protein [Nocardia jiangxiensis]
MEPGKPTVSERLAGWAIGLEFDDLPRDVVDRAKWLLLDNLGVQLLGSTLPNVQPERALVESMHTAPECTVVKGVKASAPCAAYVNGSFGHGSEFDDSHMLAWHAASALVPAALAVGEQSHHSGREVIAALVAGHEVMSRLGAVTTGAMLKTGWHGPKVLGGFGAATITAKLLGLTADQLVNAYGITASDSSGLMEYDQSGGEVKRLHAGSAARSGVESALLASHGLTGPRTVFEGPRGIFKIFGDNDSAALVDGDPQRYHILDTIFRLHPGVATVLPALDALVRLQQELDFDWHDIREIQVGMDGFAVGHGGYITRPTDAVSAHFSLAFALGLRLVTGKSEPLDYLDPARWSDPDISRVAELVRAEPITLPEGAPLLSAEVTVHLGSGESHSATEYGFRGHTSNPASLADVRAKFKSNALAAVSEETAEAIIWAVDSLDSVDDIAELTALLQ